ncbi:MAG: hypothetical protein HOP23_03650 [Methylococcaceae bacterium]|nr:hypothetical protein [Methylococcaceae bacterium]
MPKKSLTVKRTVENAGWGKHLPDYPQASAEIANTQVAVMPAWIAGIQNTGM